MFPVVTGSIWRHGGKPANLGPRPSRSPQLHIQHSRVKATMKVEQEAANDVEGDEVDNNNNNDDDDTVYFRAFLSVFAFRSETQQRYK